VYKEDGNCLPVGLKLSPFNRLFSVISHQVFQAHWQQPRQSINQAHCSHWSIDHRRPRAATSWDTNIRDTVSNLALFRGFQSTHVIIYVNVFFGTMQNKAHLTKTHS